MRQVKDIPKLYVSNQLVNFHNIWSSAQKELKIDKNRILLIFSRCLYVTTLEPIYDAGRLTTNEPKETF